MCGQYILLYFTEWQSHMWSCTQLTSCWNSYLLPLWQSAQRLTICSHSSFWLTPHCAVVTVCSVFWCKYVWFIIPAGCIFLIKTWLRPGKYTTFVLRHRAVRNTVSLIWLCFTSSEVLRRQDEGGMLPPCGDFYTLLFKTFSIIK